MKNVKNLFTAMVILLAVLPTFLLAVLSTVLLGNAFIPSAGAISGVTAMENDPPVANDPCRGDVIVLGGEIPVPYKEVNRTVELADGEYYHLQGEVIFLGNAPYFRIDLDQHSWLGNDKRMANPFYQLDPLAYNWKSIEGKRVEFITLAKGYVTQGQSASGEMGILHYGISLRPAIDPQVIEPSTSRR